MQEHEEDALSSNYRIFETDEFLKRLKKLTSSDVSFIKKKLQTYVYPQLKKEPCFGKNIKKLKDYSPDTWRYRIGKFRLFYTVDHEKNIIYILTIDFRKDVYR
jgi:mRNA interferase RelE/StbE